MLLDRLKKNKNWRKHFSKNKNTILLILKKESEINEKK